MPRNLDRRIELLVPVEDPPGAEKLAQILETCLAETRQAWTLRSDGAWERRQPDAKRPAVRAQEEFQRRAEARAAEALQRQAPVLEPQRPAEQKKQA